jgi:PhzF family phenazine biosynthesis protein
MARCVFPVSKALEGHGNLVDFALLDAFTAEAFKGNPAAVCLLPIARSKEWMQSVAMEFNAPMAAFLVERSSGEYEVRFFTPVAEVDLCGHATLASAYLVFRSGLVPGAHVVFHTPSSTLQVKKVMIEEESWQGQVELSLPFMVSVPVALDTATLFPRTLQSCKAISTLQSEWDRLLVELPSASYVEALQPCFEEFAEAARGGVIVTGKAPPESSFDFVSRFFAPQLGVPEDPVCGTAHCALAPWWAAKLGKQKLVAYQASKRGGVLELLVDHDAKRVLLRGTAVIVSAGVLLS